MDSVIKLRGEKQTQQADFDRIDEDPLLIGLQNIFVKEDEAMLTS